MTWSGDSTTGLNDLVEEFLQDLPAEQRDEHRETVRAAMARADHQTAGEAGNQEGDDAWDAEGSLPWDQKTSESWDDEPWEAYDQLRAARAEGFALGAQAIGLSPDPRLKDAMYIASRYADSPLIAHQGTTATGWRPAPDHFVMLRDVNATPLRWLSPGRLAAGKITVLDGDPGLGKSTLLCELAARVSRGEALPGGEPGDPRGVVKISAEDDLHDTIRPRIDAAAGDPDCIMSLLAVSDGTETGRPFEIPGDGPLLEMLVRQIDAALVIIDPLVAYLHGGLNANSDHDVRRALAALKVVGERSGVAIVVVRHLNKSAGSNPLYRGGESIGIIGAARCGLVLAPDPDDPERRILAASKGNLSRPPASLAFRLADAPEHGVARVVWDGESTWTARALLRASEDESDDRSALADARAWLRAALADGPRPTKEIEREAAANGITIKTLERARKAEGVVSRKERTPGGRWLLSIPSSSGAGPEDRQVPRLGGLDGVGGLQPADRRCVDCGTPLGDRPNNRCVPCFANKLTDAT